MVVLSEDRTRIAAVTYWQHSGRYTRIGGRNGFQLSSGTHPVVYAGRNNHGSYHNSQTWAQTCCYWEDHRDGEGPQLRSWLNPLIELRSADSGGEEWMDETGFPWGYEGVWNHPMTNTDANCYMKTCAGTPTWGCQTSGCFRSQCLTGDRDDGVSACEHCAAGCTNMYFWCGKDFSTHDVNRYDYSYHIPHSDAGLLYKIPGWYW